MIIGRFDAAQVEFEQGIRYRPEIGRDALQPRQTIFHAGQLGAGAKEFEEALRIDPSYVEAMDALGIDAGGLRGQRGCRRKLRKAIALNRRT